jgi:hypothetical protein
MATQEKFKSDFIAYLWKTYGEDKLSEERISLLWNKMKTFPDDVLLKCAQEVVARNTYLPGVDRIISSVMKTFDDYQKALPRARKVIVTCHTCGGDGLKIVDNTSFSCRCAAGDQNYPNFPKYDGQAPFGEKLIFEDAEKRVIESRYTISTLNKRTKETSFYFKENPWGNQYRKPETDRRPGASHE